MLGAQLAAANPTIWRVDGEPTQSNGVTEAWIAFETKLARGRGILRLEGRSRLDVAYRASRSSRALRRVRGDRVPWAWRMASIGGTRPRSTRSGRKKKLSSRRTSPIASWWAGGRAASRSGLGLKQLGCSNDHPGKERARRNSWRNRYRSLVLHDPVWYDHLPYLPFPENWPVFTPKDKVGDWLEMYAKVMELDYWASSECVHAEYDEDKSEWSVDVVRHGARTTLRPKQLVFATGAYGPPNVISLAGRRDVPGSSIATRAATRPASLTPGNMHRRRRQQFGARRRRGSLGHRRQGHDAATFADDRRAARRR